MRLRITKSLRLESHFVGKTFAALNKDLTNNRLARLSGFA
jgi:hypothetical protein